MSNAYARAAIADRRELDKAIEVLHGICLGITSDGQLRDEEVRFLDNWLLNNDSVTRQFPGNVVAARVKHVLADGVITQDERAYLLDTLTQLVGGTLFDTGTTAPQSTELPIDDDVDVEVRDSVFVLTGGFLFGTRTYVEECIAEKRGRVFDDVTKDVHFLVIGGKPARDWAHTSFGRKIEKAVAYQDTGVDIAIISESRWIDAMSS